LLSCSGVFAVSVCHCQKSMSSKRNALQRSGARARNGQPTVNVARGTSKVDVKMDIAIPEAEAEKISQLLASSNLSTDPTANMQAIAEWTKQMFLTHFSKLTPADVDYTANEMVKKVFIPMMTKIAESDIVTASQPDTSSEPEPVSGPLSDPKSYLWEQRPSTSDGRGMVMEWERTGGKLVLEKIEKKQ
ncbi:hypothetical protein PENTCL1PPCAC_5611, partial [Pristionchus entomophagus]